MIEYKSCVLGDLVSKEKKSIISGPFGSNIGKKFFKESGVPVIRGNNLSTNHEKFQDSGFVFITEDKARELNCYAIPNDLVFTAVGTIGQVGIIGENQKYAEYTISNKQLRVRLDLSKVLPLYAYYWFSAPWTQKLILQRNVGSTVPLINLSVAKGLPIELPNSLDVQQRIVDVLESINSKIEVNNKINAELEAMAKLIYDYWFVQFDFPFDFAQGKPDANGQPYKSSGGKMVYNEQLKREIPEGWGVKTFGDYSKVSSGFAFKSTDWAESGVGVLKIKDIKEDFTLDLTGLSYVPHEKAVRAKRFLAKKGDLVIAMTGATIGKFGVIPSYSVPIYINQRVGLYSLGDEPFRKLPFILNGMKQQYFREKIFQIGGGAAQPNISGAQLDSIKMVMPSSKLIDRYNSMFRSNYELIANNIEENQKLSELRDWLLPMLMNGQVTVNKN